VTTSTMGMLRVGLIHFVIGHGLYGRIDQNGMQ
jgi:hypothetical protein